MAWAAIPTLAPGTDLPTGFTAGDTSRAKNRVVMETAFLGPCADAAAADTGEAVTAAPAADQAGLPTWWGRGRGNWITDDEDRVDVIIADNSQANYTCANTQNIQWTVSLAASNLTFTFYNRSAAAGGGAGAGPLRLTFIYWQSFSR